MANLIWRALVPATATLLSSACSVPESTSDLVPEGPPYVRQFFIQEQDAGRRPILAFGWHPDVPNGRDGEDGIDRTHPVTSAAVSDQELRVVFDELLIGSNLEEIECRDPLGSFSRVPLGATPDDIAGCSVANDLLPEFCKGEHAVCLDSNGVPRGVLDSNEDGAADNIRMIAGVVGLRCGTIDVPISQEASFWQPAGNQLVPVLDGVPVLDRPSKSLGPALIVVPLDGALPSGSDCTLTLSPEVVDKDFIRPCTPSGGEEDTDNIGDCTPGDLAALTFSTETIALDSSVPANGSTGVAVSRRTTAFILTADPDPDSLATATVSIMEGAGTRTDIMSVALNASNTKRVEVTLTNPLVANTMYRWTLSNLKDRFGVTIDPITVTYMTAP
jgi:hypothetical protein